MVKVRGPTGGSDGWSAAGAGDEEHLDGLQRAARSGGYLRWAGLASDLSVYCVIITYIWNKNPMRVAFLCDECGK